MTATEQHGLSSTAPPTQPGPTPAGPSDPLSTYHAVTDTVGGLSLRLRDNLIQAAIIVVATAIGAIAGYIWKESMGAIIVGAGAMIVSTLVSGFALMILGWIRTAKKL